MLRQIQSTQSCKPEALYTNEHNTDLLEHSLSAAWQKKRWKKENLGCRWKKIHILVPKRTLCLIQSSKCTVAVHV